MSSSDSDEEWKQAEAQIKQHFKDVSELSSNASDSDIELSSLSPLRRLIDGGGGGTCSSRTSTEGLDAESVDANAQTDSTSDTGDELTPSRGELPNPIGFVAVQKQRLTANFLPDGRNVGTLQKGEFVSATAIRAVVNKGHKLEGVLRARGADGSWASVFDENGQRMLEMTSRHAAVRPRRIK